MILNLNWMTLALLTAICWGLVNVLDKEILNNHSIEIRTRQLLDSLFGLIVAALLLWKLSSPSLLLVTLGILGVALVYFFNYLYYRALKKADVSAVSVYLQSIPVFSAIIGFVFFAERFYSEVYLGAVLVILGAILVAIERTANNKFTIFQGKNMEVLLKYVLIASLIMSVNYGFIKELLKQYNFWEVFFWGRIGFGFMGIFVYIIRPGAREGINQNIKTMGARTFFSVGCIEALNFLGIFLLTAAYSVGTITLVSTAVAVQPLMVIMVLILIAGLSNKNLLGDFNLSKRVLIVRTFAVLLQVIGMFLLSRSQL